MLSRYSGRASPVVLIHIPDGHVKEVNKAGSKHKAPSSEASAKEVSYQDYQLLGFNRVGSMVLDVVVYMIK